MVRRPDILLFAEPLQGTASKEFSAESFYAGWSLYAQQMGLGSRPVDRVALPVSSAHRSGILWDRPNGEGLLLASLPIAHSPVFPAIKIDPQVETIAIVELADSALRGGVLTFDCG
jgi:hypothetical protein